MLYAIAMGQIIAALLTLTGTNFPVVSVLSAVQHELDQNSACGTGIFPASLTWFKFLLLAGFSKFLSRK